MQVYDGRTETWVELRLVRMIAERWMPFSGGGGAVELRDAPVDRSEPAYQARWYVGEHKIALGNWRPSTALADSELRETPRPIEAPCPKCAARWLYGVANDPGFVCAVCGAALSRQELVRERSTSRVFQVGDIVRHLKDPLWRARVTGVRPRAINLACVVTSAGVVRDEPTQLGWFDKDGYVLALPQVGDVVEITDKSDAEVFQGRVVSRAGTRFYVDIAAQRMLYSRLDSEEGAWWRWPAESA